MERGAFHAWHELDRAGFPDIHDEAVDDLVAEVAMGHLAAFEAEAGFDLVAIAEEADGLIFLGLVVMLVDGDGELDFLDDDDLLLLASGAVALVLLVQVFAVVLDLADGRNGVGRDLDEVEGLFAGHLQGLKRGHDAELFTIFVDNAHFTGADTFVGANKRLGGAFVEWWDKQPPRRVLRTAMLLGECCISAGNLQNAPRGGRNRSTREYSRYGPSGSSAQGLRRIFSPPLPCFQVAFTKRG